MDILNIVQVDDHKIYFSTETIDDEYEQPAQNTVYVCDISTLRFSTSFTSMSNIAMEVFVLSFPIPNSDGTCYHGPFWYMSYVHNYG